MTPRVTILTGAASGIGKHFAGVLAREPREHQLFLADIDREGLEAAFVPDESLATYSLDIRSLAGWQALVAAVLARFKRIDYLFNIAGGGRPAFLKDLPPEDIDFGIDLNLKGPLYGMKVVGEVMARQGSGHIINMGSLAGIVPTPGNLVYSAAKAGLRHASLSAAVELRKSGVYVTLVSPDLVATPIYERNMWKGAAAALNFSGPRPLAMQEVERALFKAMRERPLEITLPRWRGWLAKINDLAPNLIVRLYEPMRQRGLRKMEAAQREFTHRRGSGPGK